MEREIDYRVKFLLIFSFKFQEYLQQLGDERYDYEDFLKLSLFRLDRNPENAIPVLNDLIKVMLNSKAQSLAHSYLNDTKTNDLTSMFQKVNAPADRLLNLQNVSEYELLNYATRSIYQNLPRKTRSIGLSGDENIVREGAVDESPKTGPASRDASSPRTPEPRYLVADTNGEVKTGQTFQLQVKVSTKKSSDAPGHASASLPEMEGTLTITVHAKGIEFLDGTSRTLNVPATGDSSPVNFELKATASGPKSIHVMAWKESAHITGMTVELMVDGPATAASSQSAPIEMREPEKGEFTLEIVYDEKQQQYRFQLRGEKWGTSKPYFINTASSQFAQYQTLLASLNDQAKNLNNLSQKAQSFWLQGLGTLMAEKVLPEELRYALWEQKDNISRFNILCDGDTLPWELMYLRPPQGGDGFYFSDMSSVARWRYGRPAPAKLNFSDCFLVHPAGSPAYAQGEIDEMVKLFPGAQVIKTIDELNELLQNGSFSLLHFASHNDIDTETLGGSYVPFGKSKFDLIFMGAVPKSRFTGKSPLIFMNACTSAGKIPLFTEMSSWADQYLGLGAGAFVGSLWEIVDQSAPEFALTFYDQLKQGQTLGQAMKKSRDAIGTRDPGDPTRFAYTLYGNPQATLK